MVQVTGAQCRGVERDGELSFSLGLPMKAPSVKAALRAVGSQQEKSWGGGVLREGFLYLN